MELDQKFGALRKGLLEFVILKIVSAEKVYVADMLRVLQGTDFATQEGTLYPMLGRLRRENLVDYEWQESGSGPPRKYYQLTPKGQTYLEELAAYWQHINSTLATLGR
jgi:PadR family transcriptional regulator, regulatory protein PadR